MNAMMRRLIAGGLSAVAVLWATHPGVASASAHVRRETETASATSAKPSGEVYVACGNARTYSANSDIQSVQLDNYDLAAVTANGRELTVIGLKEGTTIATIRYAASSKPVLVRICVARAGAVVQTAADLQMSADAAQGKRSTATSPTSGSEPSYVQQLPTISLECSSPVTATVGKVVEQQIFVRNLGGVSAEQVEVRGSLSIDAELIATEPRADVVNSVMVWRFTSIPAGGQQQITIRVKPLVAGELSCQTNVSFKSTAAVKTQVLEPKLKLVCDAPNSVLIGNEVRVVMTVTNVGSAAAEGIRIRQVVPGVVEAAAHTKAQPLMLEVGTLQPGESSVLETSSVAREPGLVRIQLVAQSVDGSQSSAEHVLRVTAPQLSLTSTGPDFRYLNRKGTYQFTLSNPGDAAAANVNLMVGLPEGLEFVDASGQAVFDAQKRTIAWAIGSMDAQQTREFTVTVLPRTEGQHLQRAVAWADGNLLAKADKVTRVEGVSALVMEIKDVDDPIEIGSETAYQIHIVNRGSKTAERVQVAAIVPEGLIPLRVESSGRYRMQGQNIQFETIAALAPQASTVLQVYVKGAAHGSQRFRAIMTSPSIPSAVVTEETTEVYSD